MKMFLTVLLIGLLICALIWFGPDYLAPMIYGTRP